MAPSTRLRAKPERRVDYFPSGRAGTRGNPIPLEDTPEPEANVRQRSHGSEPTSTRKTTRKPAVRVKAGAVAKPKATLKKASKAAAKPKKKERPLRQDCSICANNKSTSRSFKVPEDANTCEHFETICGPCIQNMLRTKVAGRQLTEAELDCPFPNCDHVLDFAALKKTISTAVFEQYDKALTQHLLSSNESYIACLSPKCGMYFSIEDCKSNKRGKKMAACPYCEYEICMTCNRPWESHGSGSCDKAKEKEDQESAETIKSIGAKPCPKCGVNIQKNGGCDHMTCQRCRHNFCWQCLASYSTTAQHADSCPHNRINVAADPHNWAPENMNVAQVNNLIRQAQDRLDNQAAHPPPPVFAHPLPRFHPPPVPFVAMGTPPPLPAGFNFGHVLNIFARGPVNGGGAGGGPAGGPH